MKSKCKCGNMFILKYRSIGFPNDIKTPEKINFHSQKFHILPPDATYLFNINIFMNDMIMIYKKQLNFH
jgi:hypothetical protein